jgi:hypothetical protein
MVYGITNGTKNDFESLTGFIKFAIFDLSLLLNYIKDEKI